MLPLEQIVSINKAACFMDCICYGNESTYLIGLKMNYSSSHLRPPINAKFRKNYLPRISPPPSDLKFIDTSKQGAGAMPRS